MNKRYRELEKKAKDARRTYEKIKTKHDKLMDQTSRMEKALNKVIKQYEIVNQECSEDYPEEQYKQLKNIINKCGQVNKYGDNYLTRIEEEVDKLSNQYEVYDTRVNEIMEENKSLIEEMDKLEHDFKGKWESDRASVTEQMAQDVAKKYSKLLDEKKELKHEGMVVIGKRDECKVKIDKLIKKSDRYTQLLTESTGMLQEFRTKYGLNDYEDFIKLMEEMNDAYKEKTYMLGRITMCRELLNEHQHELDQLKFKLSIAKDKMEEAEYQFREYKNMIGAA